MNLHDAADILYPPQSEPSRPGPDPRQGALDFDTTTYRGRLRAYFEARRGQWIDGMELAQVAGAYGWRSRVSNLRTIDGLTIENRQRRVGRRVVSEYRLVEG